MPDDDGIAGPVLKVKPPAPPRVQDLSSTLVSNNTDTTLDSISAQAAPWRAQINAAAQALKPDVDAVSGKQSGLVNQVDPSGIGIGQGLVTGNYAQAVKGLNDGLNAPFSTLADFYQAAKVNTAIQQFTAQNGSTLRDMNSSMALAQRSMDQLAELAQNFTPSARNASALIDQKRSLGADMSAQIDDAIANNTDPDAADKLQGMKDDWDNWLASRDQRVANEQPVVNQLDAQAATINAQAKVDGSTFMNAANLTDKLIGGSADPNTTYSQHMTSAAQNFAQQLQQTLVYSRAQFESALK